MKLQQNQFNGVTQAKAGAFNTASGKLPQKPPMRQNQRGQSGAVLSTGAVRTPTGVRYTG